MYLITGEISCKLYVRKLINSKIGATGKQGSAVVKHLTGENLKIKALVRSLDSDKSKKLQDAGIELCKGSLEDEDSVYNALEGIEGAFLVTTPFLKGAEAELSQGQAFVNAAKRRNLKHLVFTSVDGAERKSGVPHFDSKYEVEKLIAQAKIPTTILRPTAFYDNFQKRSDKSTSIFLGIFESALRGKPVQMVGVDDIGHVAADALRDPKNYIGKAIPLAGDELTVKQIQDAYGRVQGNRPWKAWIPGFMLYGLPYDFRTMLKWFYTSGYKANINQLKSEHKYVKSFEEWLRSD